MTHELTRRSTPDRRLTDPQREPDSAPDRSDAHRLVTALRRATLALDAGSAVAQARLAISRTQLAALELLSAGSPSLVGHIASELGISTGTASEMLEQLVARGLVVRVDDPADRRRTLVSITLAGRRRFRSAFKERWAWIHVMASQLSARDCDVVSDFLERLCGVMPRDWSELGPAPPPEIHLVHPTRRRRRAATPTRASRRQSPEARRI